MSSEWRSMVRALVDDSEAVLLDLNGTFAFDCDRLSADEDFPATYEQVGGSVLQDDEVRGLILAVRRTLHRIGRDPARYDSFPSVPDTLRSLEAGAKLPSEEIDRLARVFALHEVGRVPSAYAAAVATLANCTRLGLVSNIWGASQPFVDSLREARVDGHFETLVFSSDHGVIKPSPRIFQVAMEEMRLRPHEAIYVGNSFRRDVVGARNAGIRVLWIDAESESPLPGYSADATASDFREFVEAVA